jgi:hypothetical protein
MPQMTAIESYYLDALQGDAELANGRFNLGKESAHLLDNGWKYKDIAELLWKSKHTGEFVQRRHKSADKLIPSLRQWKAVASKADTFDAMVELVGVSDWAALLRYTFPSQAAKPAAKPAPKRYNAKAHVATVTAGMTASQLAAFKAAVAAL